MLDGTFFRTVGPNVRDRYRDHIFRKDKDVYGKAFKKYSTKYGIKKRANTFKRQASRYASSLAPVLTSDLLRDYTLIDSSAKGFEIGWVSQGVKIGWLIKSGRRLTTKDRPFPKHLTKYMDKELSRQHKKENPNKKTRHKIGKKK